jgi:methyl-accepting chemotaxis protein
VTTERRADEMLDRLLGTVNALADVAERSTRDISALKFSVDGWVNVVQIHQQSIEAVVTEMREMHAEIKEL